MQPWDWTVEFAETKKTGYNKLELVWSVSSAFNVEQNIPAFTMHNLRGTYKGNMFRPDNLHHRRIEAQRGLWADVKRASSMFKCQGKMGSVRILDRKFEPATCYGCAKSRENKKIAREGEDW